ncbi:hypothetical protein SRM1_00726 [Pseudomonas fluorescens]|nr:hypothetical protein SRM1_00726 [Pseudomonas fluorescens]
MNFVIVEILQAQAVARQQPGYRVHRRHQQAFGAVDEVHRRRFAIAQVGQDRQTTLLRPFLTAKQHHRRTVREGCGITRRQRAFGAFFERRFQRGEFFQGQVRAQVVVTGQAEERRHQIVVPAFAIRRGQFVMTF